MARTSPVNPGYTIINGTGTGINANRIDVWVEYLLGSPNISENCTPVSACFYTALAEGYQSGTSLDNGLDSALKVDGLAGTGVTNGAYSFLTQDQINFLGSFSGNIPHNADGTKTLSIQGSFTTASIYISGGSVSASVELPAIARAATLGATDAQIGKTSVIAVSVKNPDCLHSIGYRFGSLSGYLTEDGQLSSQEVRMTATSIPFTVPESFYWELPEAQSGICTLTCTTYREDAQLGEAQTATFTVSTVEGDCRPLVSGSVEDINPVTLALTGDKTVLIKGFSNARCVINAQGQKGAAITEKTVGGVAAEDEVELEQVEQIPVLQAVDSRGYVTQFTPDVMLLEYTRLTSNSSVSRDDPTSGNATVTLMGSCYAGSFGAVDNSISVSYRINEREAVQVQPAITFEKGMYMGSFPLTGLDYANAYTLELTVSDALMAVSKTMSIHKGTPVFDWGEENFVFHVPVHMPQLSCPQLEEILQRLDALENR